MHLCIILYVNTSTYKVWNGTAGPNVKIMSGDIYLFSSHSLTILSPPSKRKDIWVDSAPQSGKFKSCGWIWAIHDM